MAELLEKDNTTVSVPAKLKKSKKHKDKLGKSSHTADQSPSFLTADQTITSKSDSKKSSTKKRKRSKDAEDSDSGVASQDSKPPNRTSHDINPTANTAAAPSSPPKSKKHKKHHDKTPKSAEGEVTLFEMLLEDRELTKAAEAEEAAVKRREREAAEREAEAEKAARKARKAAKKAKKAELKGKSASAPDSGTGTGTDDVRGGKKKRHGKRASSERDGAASENGGEEGAHGKKVGAEDVSERWNVGGLEGGSQRRSKFMRLLGAKKVGLPEPAAGAVKPAAGFDSSLVADELERQFESGRRMKYESGGQKKGLGA
jgi:hypothetical protein